MFAWTFGIGFPMLVLVFPLARQLHASGKVITSA
jgi:hypothetical protein